jgi:hypothetical protein
MGALHPDESDFGTALCGRSDGVMKQLRGRFLTVLWAGAVLVATAGWMYFIGRGAWIAVTWFLR